MENIKCIIFDCDGVLVDSEAIGNQTLIDMAKEFGLQMTLEAAYSNFNGRSLKDCFTQIENLIERKLPDDFESNYRIKSFAAFKKDLKPMEGAKAFIDSLNIAYCVASSGPMDKIILNLTTTGLIDKFQGRIFSAYDINSWKPDPGIFLHAAKEMGFPITECIVIEDSRAGVIAAKRGGFKVYGFANGINDNDLSDEGAIVFHSFEALSTMLKSGNA